MATECVKVCPQRSELSVINTSVVCPEDGCGKIFQGSSSLNMHVIKHHQHTSLPRRDLSVPTYYYCPEESCVYHVSASRFFTQMKYLKQHFLKVHGERKFACAQCNKTFPTKDSFNYHKHICGIIFCCSCGNTYSSYEALLTHSKRKQHTYDEKFKLYGKRVKAINRTIPVKNSQTMPSSQPPPIYILPKLSSDTVGVPVNILAAVALTELSGSCSKAGVDKDVQTEHVETRRKKASSPARATERGSKKRASAQTQTGVISRARRPKKSTKTQTIEDSMLKYISQFSDPTCEDSCSEKESVTAIKRKKSMETQTSTSIFETSYMSDDRNFEMQCGDNVIQTPKLLTDTSLSSSPIYPLAKDVGLPDLWFTHKNTSSTQTSPVTAGQSSVPSDLNLTFFECDSNVPASSLRNLNYFEENSDSLDTVVNNTQFESGTNSTSENLNALENSDYQTSVYPLLSQTENRSCNIETQTELDSSNAFLSQCTDGSEGQYTLCSNIETQTTEDIFDELLYSNMCTQTCDEGLFSDLDFVDIETQTAWPNYNDPEDAEPNIELVETQTLTLSSPSSSSENSKQIQAKNKDCPGALVKVVKRHHVQSCDQKFGIAPLNFSN